MAVATKNVGLNHQNFFLAKRPDTVLVFPTSGDQVILVREKQPHQDDFVINFLGGRHDKGESLLECAQRELLEESGMVSNDWQLWKTYYTGSKLSHAVHFYIARNVREIADQKLDPGGEIIEVKSFSFDNFIDLIVEGNLGRGDFRADILYRKLKGTMDEFKQALFG